MGNFFGVNSWWNFFWGNPEPLTKAKMTAKITTAMTKYPEARGIAVIIFNTYKKTNSPLSGTVKDGEEMDKTFQSLGFATIPLPDASKDEICGIVEAICSYQNYRKEYDCFAITFCGHGRENSVIISDDNKEINLEEAIIQPFNASKSPYIAGFPKIIFIDACKGKLTDTVKATGPTPQPPNDVLLAYSTKEGDVAYEFDDGGCWMQILAKELRESHEPVNVVLTNVNKKMKEINKGWQEPQTSNTTVDIVLNPAHGTQGGTSGGGKGGEKGAQSIGDNLTVKAGDIKGKKVEAFVQENDGGTKNQTQRIGKNANVQIGNVTGDSVKIAVQSMTSKK